MQHAALRKESTIPVDNSVSKMLIDALNSQFMGLRYKMVIFSPTAVFHYKSMTYRAKKPANNRLSINFKPFYEQLYKCAQLPSHKNYFANFKGFYAQFKKYFIGFSIDNSQSKQSAKIQSHFSLMCDFSTQPHRQLLHPLKRF
ncbi:MAG TPA: hypothetical protein VFD11_04560 [Thiopseudomonas sp.]|nr:hypothetical protein [Thiopseudomonas sp.]